MKWKTEIVLMCGLVAVGGCRSEQRDCVRGDEDAHRSEATESAASLIGAESLSDVLVCRSGGFAMMRMREANSNDVLVLHNNKALFWAVEGQSGDLSAIVLENGNPKVYLTDADADSEFDSLSYDVYFPEQERVLTVIDANLDGQADSLIHPTDDRGEYRVWVGNAWHKAVRRNGKLGVLLGQEFSEIAQSDSGWKFVTQ